MCAGASVLGEALDERGGGGVGRAVFGEGALDFCDGSGSADKGRGWEVSFKDEAAYLGRRVNLLEGR